jgi:spore coat protein U-like protein
MKRRTLFLVLFIISFYYNASAQSLSNASASHTVSLTLNNTIDISFITGGSGINMAFNNADDYQNGVIANNAANIRIRSNKNFNVTVKSASAYFTSSSATNMPVSNVLYVKEINQSSFVNMSNSDQKFIN